MSKTNLEYNRPWFPDEEQIRSIFADPTFRRLLDSLTFDDLIGKEIKDRLWQMIMDLPNEDPEPIADEMVIPYWYGAKPEKKSRWSRFKKLLTW